MSSTPSTSSSATPVTVPAVRARKVRDGSEPMVMVTAYDAPGARIASEAGVDMILVGDSLAMVVLGYDDTLQVTVDDMAHHTAAVARAKPAPLIVADLPWLSYHVSVEDTVRNAAVLVRAGAEAVKLEGGTKRIPMIEAIVDGGYTVTGTLDDLQVVLDVADDDSRIPDTQETLDAGLDALAYWIKNMPMPGEQRALKTRAADAARRVKRRVKGLLG